MRECASRAALATLTRLAHALGYEGSQELKQHFLQAFTSETAYAARARTLQDASRKDADWLEALNETQLANVAIARSLNTRAQFDQAAPKAGARPRDCLYG